MQQLITIHSAVISKVKIPPNVPGMSASEDNGSIARGLSGTKFDKDEDHLIAKAWIKATTEPKFGTWQKGNTFFKTLYTHFTGWVSHVNSRICPGEIPMPEGCTINAIKQRWFVIQKGANKILAVCTWYPIRSGEDHAKWQERCFPMALMR